MTLCFPTGDCQQPVVWSQKCFTTSPGHWPHHRALAPRVCVRQAQGPSRAPAVFVWPAAVPQNTAALIRAGHLAPDKSSSVAGIWPIPALCNWSQPSDQAGSNRGRLLIQSAGEGDKGDDASRQGEEQAAEMDYGA